MAALTADVHIPHKGNLDQYKIALPAVGADTFYAGAILYADETSGKVQTTPAAGDSFVGICAKQVVAAAADDLVEVYVGGVWALAYASAAEGDQGDVVVSDTSGTKSDNEADLVTLALAAFATDDVLIGKMIGMHQEETTRAWVILQPGFLWDDTDKAWI